jgi:hypothetical protein
MASGPNGFNTNYVIAVTLEGLEQLKALRAELAALRAESAAPIEYKINVTSGKGTGRSTTSASGVEKVTVDASKFEAAADKIVRAMDSLATGMKNPRGTDEAALGRIVGEAVGREMSRFHGAGGASTRTTSVPMSESRRAQLKRERDNLADVPMGLGKPLDQITEFDGDKIVKTLQQHAKALGGAFQKELDTHLRQMSEAARSALHGGFADSGGTAKGRATQDAEGNISRAIEQVASDVQGRRDDIAAAHLATLKGLFTKSKKLVEQRYKQLDDELAAGVEQRVEAINGFVGTGGIGALSLSGSPDLNRKILATMRLAGRGLNKSLETLANRMSEVVALKMDAMVQAIANVNVTAMVGGPGGSESGSSFVPSLPIEGAATAQTRRAFGGLRKKRQRSEADRIQQAANRHAKREAKLTEIYERMDAAQRERFNAEADAGRVYFDKPEALGIPASLGGRKGVQGAIAYMMRQGAGGLATRAGTQAEHISSAMPGYDMIRVNQEAIDRVTREFREARSLGKQAYSLGDFDSARKARERAAKAIQQFRELQEHGRVQQAMHGRLPEDVTQNLFGPRGPRVWDPALDEDEGRRFGVTPKRARAMAAAMLRGADDLDARAARGEPGVAMSTGMAGLFAKKLGSARSVISNLQAGHQEFGKFDAKSVARYKRMQQQDEFLRFVLPATITPSNMADVSNDVKAMQDMYQEKADMARMVTLSKRNGSPGRFDSQGNISGAKGMEFQPYSDDVKEQLIERMKLLEKLQFSRTPQILDSKDAVLDRSMHHYPAGPGARLKKNRPAQAYYDKNQMSYYADTLAAWYQAGGESYSGQFTGYHQLNATLERMGLPPIGPKAAAAEAAGAGGSIGGGGGGGGGSGGGLPPTGGSGGGGGFNWGDMDPKKAEAVVNALKQLESVRLSGLAGDMKEIAAAMNGMAKNASGDPRLMAFIASQAERENIAFRAQKKLDVQGGTLRDLQSERIADRKLSRAARAAQGRKAFGRVFTDTVDYVSQELPLAGPESGLSQEQLASLFMKQEGRLANSQQAYHHLVNRNAINPLRSKRIRDQASEVDTNRVDLFQTLRKLGATVPKWYTASGPDSPSISSMVSDYERVQGERLSTEKIFKDFRSGGTRGAGQQGPLPKEAQDRRESALTKAILSRRREEDELTKSILARSSAEIRAAASQEHQLTFVDRLTGKLKTLSAYAGAGMLLYGAASILKNAYEVPLLSSAIWQGYKVFRECNCPASG